MKKIIFFLIIVNSIILMVGCSDKKNDILKGIWVATPKNQRVYQIGPNKTKGGKEKYFLECDNGKYTLRTKTEDLANASYTISDNIVTFYDEGRQILGICKHKNKELDCNETSHYAFKYKRLEN